MSGERVIEPGPDQSGARLKAIAEAYIAGMNTAAKSVPRIDSIGERVDGLPDRATCGLGERCFVLSGITLTFTNGEGEKFTREAGLDLLDGFSCCFGHGSEPTQVG